MTLAELAARLVTADDAGRARLLGEHRALAGVELAYALKDICLDEWSTTPARATAVASALQALVDLTNDAEVEAVSLWMAGFAAAVREGQVERALALLGESESRFLSLGKPHMAASTRVIKLYALALVGRYDEAIDCGLGARRVFLEHGDSRAAAKIEHNLATIHIRRERYREAEEIQLAARLRFADLGDRKMLVKADNNLAIIYTAKHEFRLAEELYERARRTAEGEGLVLLQAQLEASVGNLALLRGRYDRALDYLESSRRKFDALGMPHESAVARQEIADAYLELNLAPEAAAIYEEVTKVFAGLGMRAERARALAQHGRALILLGETGRAHGLLEAAGRLYADEGNAVGQALVTLLGAQLLFAGGDYDAAASAALAAEGPLAAAGTWRRQLLARWLRGEAGRAAGRDGEARALLASALSDAEAQSQPDIAQRCHTSLGLLDAAAGDTAAAEASFKRAVALTEDLRTPLPSEEFRTAFFSDKLAAYDELARLCLADEARAAEALCYVEGARSRALADVLGGALEARVRPRDAFEARLLARLEELREELNWFYGRIDRPAAADAPAGPAQMRGLHDAARERERETLEIVRQLQQRNQSAAARAERLDLAGLRSALGTETALVEYTSTGGELLAFVVTGGGVEVVRDLGTEGEAKALLGQLRFQMETLRYGAERVRKHLPHLTARAQSHLRSLYDLLLRPVEARVAGRRLVVVPHRALHYVPFHALHDGEAHVVERREVSYAPSATVLLHCLARQRPPLQRALLVGVADERAPRVRDEIDALASLFPEPVSLLGERATLASVREFAPGADVLHLACHGRFRPDNPLFSSLRLSDGWLTVRDTYNLDLRCGLVALSACETGVNEVAPGDELIGLARGFFSAGAPTLLLSLWTVDDKATASLMADFYRRLLAGSSPAAALREAQLRLMREQPHPYFWSPFVLVGRW